MKKIISLFLVITVLASVCCFAQEESKDYDAERAYDTAMALIKLYGITDRDENAILKRAVLVLMQEDREKFNMLMDEIAKGVDENCAYYSDEEWKTISEDLYGQTGGIGITVMSVSGYVEIVSIAEGGSAFYTDIEPGDRLVKADGVDITGMDLDVAISHIRGEEGTPVTVTVMKKDGSLKDYKLIRKVIKLDTVYHKLLEEEKVGYISISSFSERTGEETIAAFDEFKADGVKNIIIDLRNNGGGAMNAALEIASVVLDEGQTIISLNSKHEDDKETFLAEGGEYNFNIVILTNGYTASASEILTAALTENNKAVSVGEKTYGKATVQQMYPLVEGGVFKITVEQYKTPKGNFIHKQGIKPDYEVYNTTKRYELSDLDQPSYLKKFREGDKDEEIKKIEVLLDMLNYDVGEPDEVFDEKTRRAVAMFQESADLFPYGVCDLTTQAKIVDKILNSDFLNDEQFDYALTLFKQ